MDAVQGTVLTVGHSNVPLEDFVSNLTQHEISLVVDVRSYPRSKYASHFNAPDLGLSLQERGISYEYMGKKLGGRPEADWFYDADGHVLYNRLAESELFSRGIDGIVKRLHQQRLVLMCSEESPVGCHRHLLIGRVLAQMGYSVNHLRADGLFQPQDGVERQTMAPEAQLNLFLPGESVWRSVRPIRSVSRNTQPKPSLAS